MKNVTSENYKLNGWSQYQDGYYKRVSDLEDERKKERKEGRKESNLMERDIND